MKIKCVAFDCFGTLFDPERLSRDEIKTYVDHVRRDDFSPFNFDPVWYTLKAFPDVLPGIDQIRASGRKCVALSNGSYHLLSHLFRFNGIKIDHVVDLVHHRAYKPNNLDAYRAVEKDLGFLPSETLMVTANVDFGDIESSAKIGMPSKLIRTPDCRDVLSLADWLINRYDV